jgi:O-antigen ligase
MSLPRSGPGSVPVAEARDLARRQARRLSGGLAGALGMGAALFLVMVLVVLDYRFGQQAHRLVKILAGVGLGAGIVLFPRFGMLLLPVAVPFLQWMPRIPVPGVSMLNLLLFTVFAAWALRRIFAHEPVFHRTRLGGLILVILGVAALSIVRGAAFPTGYRYSGAAAVWELLRGTMTFAFYFLTAWMVRGAKDRRALTWAIVFGLAAEVVVTILLGRNGRGGRATGTFGQANDLGAFLAMFTAFAAAQLPVARGLLARLGVAAAVIGGGFATMLTVSRGGILALGLALFFVAVRTSRYLALAVLLVGVTSPLWAPDYVKDRVLGTQVEADESDEVGLENSAQIRVDTWRAILKVVTEHPLEGVGFTGLASVLPETGEALGVEVKDSAHNTYLRFLGEMGVAGLALFVLLLWRCWSLAREGMRRARDRADRQLALGLAAAVLALAVSCAFGDRFFSVLIAGNLWIACALVDDLLRERRAEDA